MKFTKSDIWSGIKGTLIAFGISTAIKHDSFIAMWQLAPVFTSFFLPSLVLGSMYILARQARRHRIEDSGMVLEVDIMKELEWDEYYPDENGTVTLPNGEKLYNITKSVKIPKGLKF